MSDALDYITGLGAVAGNLASSFYTNNKNAQLIERQNRLNIEQWQRENQYNLPIMQVERLKQAGLNPNLMYGEGAGSLLSAPSPEMRSSQFQAPQIDPLTMAQIRNLDADSKQKDKQTEGVDLQNFKLRFEKEFMAVNKETIMNYAKAYVNAGLMSSVDEYYQSAYSAAIMSSIFGLDLDDSYQVGGKLIQSYSVGGLHYSQELHDKFSALGISMIEQTRLERELYKTYVDAQKKVNKRAGEVAQMQTIIPEMINGAPRWLRPILVTVNDWLTGGHFSPSFVYSPNRSNSNHSHFHSYKSKY